VARSPLVSCLTDSDSVKKWVRRARRNLTIRSIHMQNSLRLAAGLALARLVVGLLGLQHGFWVGFATLVVLKTSSAGTRSTAAQAAIGTAVGFGVSAFFITTFGVRADFYSVLLPFVIFAAFYLPTAVSFIAGQACFTVVIVVLFNLLKPAGWDVGLIRLEDVLIGSVIGLVIGMAIWPRGASSELSGVIARLYVDGSAYARATVEYLIDELRGEPAPARTELAELRGKVEASSVDSEDVFSQYLAEPHQSDAPVMAWSELIATAHQLWFGTLAVGLLPVTAGSGSGMSDLLDGHLHSASQLDQVYQSVAASLVKGQSMAFELPERVDAAIDPEEPRTAMMLLELGAWIAELSIEVDRIRPSLEALTGTNGTRGSNEETQVGMAGSMVADQV
jgi:uncharacterized membrane protein YccC